MGYDLFGYSFMNAGGYNPYGMNMTNSLYMMNFYEQMKNYYAGRTARTADSAGSSATGSGTANSTATDFQTAFQEAFRKALQESMGMKDSTAVASSQGASGTEKTVTETASATNSTVSARNAYQTMSSYGCHPSHIWTSSFARS